MNIYVQQTIQINILRINSIANSSVLQIGTAGKISAITEAYNTGGFTGDAPEPELRRVYQYNCGTTSHHSGTGSRTEINCFYNGTTILSPYSNCIRK